MATAQNTESQKHRKSKGIHYTPEHLANFLARRLWANAEATFSNTDRPLRVLDPACGDGALLVALASLFPDREFVAIGFDTDSQAVERTKASLSNFRNCEIQIQHCDFLEFALSESPATFDIAITNPPYVRTQVLGQQHSQRLADQFGLTGRVDLYQAFLFAITNVLTGVGWIGALTSNRFLYTQAGKSTREMLLQNYRIAALYDLGDTRLFDAAVLPAIMIATKSLTTDIEPTFLRIEQSSGEELTESAISFFEAIENATEGCQESFQHDNIRYRVDSGHLKIEDDQTWRLENFQSEAWLKQISQTQQATIGDIAEVKVGIKTTADKVFIRDDWDTLPESMRPEESLLRPLITHKVAQRFIAATVATQVLYPYENESTRIPVSLNSFPRGSVYLKQHIERLSSRKYVVDAGREWFEIWVPHRATDWQADKVVWPDISVEPRFFLDTTGSVVNGDCYWIKLRPGQPSDLLHLILAVANSRVAVRFYDYRFHNKLYGRRRRFMTQYVKQFPLPDPNLPVSRKIIQVVKQILISKTPGERDRLEKQIDELVHQAFGLVGG